MNRRFTYITIIVLFIFVVVQNIIIFRCKKLNHNATILYGSAKAETALVKTEMEKNRRYRLLEYRAEQELVPNIAIQGLNGDYCFLSDIVVQPMLVFHFTEQCCLECVNDYLHILNLLSDSVLNERVIILSEYDKLNKLIIKNQNYQIIAPCYNLQEPLNIIVDYDDKVHDKPYFVVLDADLRVSFARIGSPADSISNPYFSEVSRFFNSSN